MKLNKNKIIVSALGLVIGASLAGSVSGTIAWYQYSTRANVSFIGQSGGISSNLQMRFVGEDDDDWRTQITWQEMNTELGNGGFATKIVPMTFGGIKKNAALPMDNAQTPAPLGYVQPQPGVAKMENWGRAQKANYAQFQLQLRNINHETAANDAQNVYLSKLLIQEDLRNGEKDDLSDAVRVHISSSSGVNKLISNQGRDVLTKGELDIDGDGKKDKGYLEDAEGFGFGYTTSMDGDNTIYSREELQTIVYGDDDNDNTDEIQTSYAASYDPEFNGVKYTQPELDAAALAYGKTTADIKTPAVEDNPDTDEDESAPAVYWSQEEIDLADALHDKSVNDWKVEPSDPSLVYSDNNKLYDDDSENKAAPAAGKLIGQTVVGNASYLTVTITIWVEGWQKLGDPADAIWDASKYVNSIFNVGIQFAVQDRQA